MLDPGPEVSPPKISYFEKALKRKDWTETAVNELLSTTDQNRTVLFYLFSRRKIENIQQFLEKASTEALSDACMRSPDSLIDAAVWETTEVFYQFVNKLSREAINAAITYQDDRHQTALHWAMLKHKTGDLKNLIDKIDLDILNSVLQINADTCGTPLNIAASWENSDVFNTLLQRASSEVLNKMITIRGPGRSTLLYEAAYNQNWDALLINKIHEKEFSDAVQMKDLFLLGGWTILHYAGRDNQEGDVLFEITNKTSLAAIHPALSSATFYKKTMLEIKKRCPRNFIYLLFIQISSYLSISRTEKSFKSENADWLKLLVELNKADKKYYLGVIRQHINENKNFWGGIFSIKYKDIRDLLSELSYTKPNIIEQAIILSAKFLINKLRSNLDENIKKIIQQHLGSIKNITWELRGIKSPSSKKDSDDDGKYTYARSMDLFRANPKLGHNSSKQGKIASEKEDREQKASYLDLAKYQKQWEKKPASEQSRSLSQESIMKPDKEEEIDETDSTPKTASVNL